MISSLVPPTLDFLFLESSTNKFYAHYELCPRRYLCFNLQPVVIVSKPLHLLTVMLCFSKHGSLAGYRGEVSPAGDVLLQQLIFFSRVSEPQKSLAKWLVLAEVKSGDPDILLPLLRAIKTHLEAGIYLTAQVQFVCF